MTNFKVSPNEVFSTLQKHLFYDGPPIVFDLEKSSGVWVVDSITNKTYLDMFSFFVSLPLGFNHPVLHTPHWQNRLLRAAIHKPSNGDSYTQDFASFVKTFSDVVVPPGFNHLFFIDGGTLAIENALKVAFDWKIKKVGYNVQENDLSVLHFEESFHGRSGYTLSLTNTAPVKTKLYPKFSWPRVSNPKLRFPINDAEIRRVQAAEDEALHTINNIMDDQGLSIAAMVIEPIQGEGGDNHFRPEFFQALRKIADEREVMFIVDEIQTGMGMTGKMWAYEHYGIQPDIIAFGKKAQACGIMVNNRVDEVKDNVFVEASRIDSTWNGNLVDMVRCEAFLEVYQEEGLVENARIVGEYLLNSLIALSERTGKIHNIRGKGLMCAFDFATSQLRTEFMKQAFEVQMLLITCGATSVRLRPALIFTKDNVDEFIFRVETILKRL